MFKKVRKPAQSAALVALSGAVLIGTEDGNSVVITPQTAHDIALLLPDFALQAERERISLTS